MKIRIAETPLRSFLEKQFHWYITETGGFGRVDLSSLFPISKTPRHRTQTQVMEMFDVEVGLKFEERGKVRHASVDYSRTQGHTTRTVRTEQTAAACSQVSAASGGGDGGDGGGGDGGDSSGGEDGGDGDPDSPNFILLLLILLIACFCEAIHFFFWLPLQALKPLYTCIPSLRQTWLCLGYLFPDSVRHTIYRPHLRQLFRDQRRAREAVAVPVLDRVLPSTQDRSPGVALLR